MTAENKITLALFLGLVIGVSATSYQASVSLDRERRDLIENGRQRAAMASRDGRCYEKCGSRPMEVFDSRNSTKGEFKCLCFDNRVITLEEVK